MLDRLGLVGQGVDPLRLRVRHRGVDVDQGKLAVIDNQIDTTTGTIKLKANFPNSDLHLWPGQFVNARLLLTTRKNGTVVPAQDQRQRSTLIRLTSLAGASGASCHEGAAVLADDLLADGFLEARQPQFLNA